MISITIQCGCGQRYSFEVEPVQGRMPSRVACPACGADGTAAANAAIAQQDAGAPRPEPARPAPAARPGARPGAGTKWAIAAGVAGLLLLAVIGVLLLLPSRGAGGRASGKASLAAPTEAVSEGLPNTLEELNQWYAEPPSGENAATFFLQGFGLLQIAQADRNSPNLPLIGKATLPLPGQPLPAAMKSAISALVKRNQAALDFFRQGAKRTQSRYPLDFTQGERMPVLHLSKVKQGGQVAVLSALAGAEAGEADQAAEGVLLALAINSSLGKEPLLISQMVRSVGLSAAVGGLEQALNRVSFPAGNLDRLEQSFKAQEERETAGEGLTCALVGERALNLALFDMPPEKLEQLLTGVEQLLAGAGNAPTGAQREELLAYLKDTKARKAERQFGLETWSQALAARKEPFPARLTTFKAFDARRASEAAGKHLSLAQRVTPALGGYAAKEASNLANLRLGMTALALERFRSAHDGRYPGALGDLVPALLAAVPSDPFDGQPLRYRRQAGGYLLYSIGPDLKDDGGKRMAGGKGDLVFEVVR